MDKVSLDEIRERLRKLQARNKKLNEKLDKITVDINELTSNKK